MHYVYMIQCRDGSLYTGWTTDLEKRIIDHNRGKGAKYTRGRGPVLLKYHEEFGTKQEAMQREYMIKQMSRKEKEELFRGDFDK
jgi:putative endonuclease